MRWETVVGSVGRDGDLVDFRLEVLTDEPQPRRVGARFVESASRLSSSRLDIYGLVLDRMVRLIEKEGVSIR